MGRRPAGRYPSAVVRLFLLLQLCGNGTGSVPPPPVSRKSAASEDNSLDSEPYIPGESMIIDGPPSTSFDSYSESSPSMGEEMWMGQPPAQLHVESFYDDPYACEENCEPALCCFDGRICRWLHQFGRPYYGWKWYRDFTASVGVTAFENELDLGLTGNFGTNEYLNFSREDVLEYKHRFLQEKAKKEQIDERRGRRHPSPAARPDDHA